MNHRLEKYLRYLIVASFICGSSLFASKASAELSVSHWCYGASISENGRIIQGTHFGYPGRLCRDCCGGRSTRATSAQWYPHTIRGRKVQCVLITGIGKHNDLQEAIAVFWDDWSSEWTALPGNPFPDCHRSTLDRS